MMRLSRTDSGDYAPMVYDKDELLYAVKISPELKLQVGFLHIITKNVRGAGCHIY